MSELLVDRGREERTQVDATCVLRTNLAEPTQFRAAVSLVFTYDSYRRKEVKVQNKHAA